MTADPATMTAGGQRHRVRNATCWDGVVAPRFAALRAACARTRVHLDSVCGVGAYLHRDADAVLSQAPVTCLRCICLEASW